MDGHLKLALMRRLATDMHAVVRAEQRPGEMPCCVTYYRKPVVGHPGVEQLYAHFLCPDDCPHAHHRSDVMLAPVEVTDAVRQD